MNDHSCCKEADFIFTQLEKEGVLFLDKPFCQLSGSAGSANVLSEFVKKIQLSTCVSLTCTGGVREVRVNIWFSSS